MDVSSSTYLSRRVQSASHVTGDNLILGMYLSNLFREQEHLGLRVEVPITLLVRREDSYYTGTPVQSEFTNLLWPLEIGIGYETQIGNRWIAVGEGNLWTSKKDLSIISLHKTGFTQDHGMEFGMGVERQPDFTVSGGGNHIAWRTGLNWRQYLDAAPSGHHSTGFKWVGGIGVLFGRGALGPGTNRLDIALFYLRRTPASPTGLVE
ncbi:MAG: hypothetical protein P8Y60_17535, partial [Calditrichota bacterium]